MAKKIDARVAMVAVLLSVFTLGYICGSASVPRASAQMPQLPGGLPGGGALGSITQFASSITEMEQHVTGLQKNLDEFKKVQAALTGK